MKTIYDIQQLLKSFGTIIYTGEREADLELMKDELRELYHSQLLEQKIFQTAMLLLNSEIQQEQQKR